LLRPEFYFEVRPFLIFGFSSCRAFSDAASFLDACGSRLARSDLVQVTPFPFVVPRPAEWSPVHIPAYALVFSRTVSWSAISSFCEPFLFSPLKVSESVFLRDPASFSPSPDMSFPALPISLSLTSLHCTRLEIGLWSSWIPLSLPSP